MCSNGNYEKLSKFLKVNLLKVHQITEENQSNKNKQNGKKKHIDIYSVDLSYNLKIAIESYHNHCQV